MMEQNVGRKLIPIPTENTNHTNCQNFPHKFYSTYVHNMHNKKLS